MTANYVSVLCKNDWFYEQDIFIYYAEDSSSYLAKNQILIKPRALFITYIIVISMILYEKYSMRNLIKAD